MEPKMPLPVNGLGDDTLLERYYAYLVAREALLMTALEDDASDENRAAWEAAHQETDDVYNVLRERSTGRIMAPIDPDATDG